MPRYKILIDLIQKMQRIGKYSIWTYVLLIVGFSSEIVAQEIKEINYQTLEGIVASKEAKVNVINFWATWCKPCIEEITEFETISKKYSSKDVRVTLINMDFASDIERVKMFVLKKGLLAEVVLLNEPDYDSWINKVNSNWSGAIPATLIINTKTGEQRFFQKELKSEEIQSEIESVLNK
jgi:thiol-disulfide isomerase/thioredoxin